MGEIAICAEDLSKQYRIGARQTYDRLSEMLQARAVRAATAPWRWLSQKSSEGEAPPNQEESFWALRDVSFEIRRGESVGIIGRNGAGKSTLLKILSRITEPTRGRFGVRGRVSSLLEVGTGFHPDLTGRENVYLNGSILGMSHREIRRHFDEIVEFAEVERFIDTPVKHYSSGMHVRLGFAIAAYMLPDILIVDEVLAVGDAVFQRKCMGRMDDAVATGRTVLFVSHNMMALQGLCKRAILLEGGRVTMDGPAPEVCRRYMLAATTDCTSQSWPDPATAPGCSRARLHRASVRPSPGYPADAMNVVTPLTLEFEYWNFEPEMLLNLMVTILSDEGFPIFTTTPVHEPVWHGKPFPRGLFRSAFEIPANLLLNGQYRVRVILVRNQSEVLATINDVLVFELQDDISTRGAWYGKRSGFVRPKLTWHTEFMSEAIPPGESQVNHLASTTVSRDGNEI